MKRVFVVAGDGVVVNVPFDGTSGIAAAAGGDEIFFASVGFAGGFGGCGRGGSGHGEGGHR